MYASRSVSVVVFLLVNLLGHYGKCDGLTPVSFYNNPGESCDLPEQPENGYYALNKFKFSKSRGPYYVDGSFLTYGCYPGYLLEGSDKVTCNNGVWNSPTCEFNVADDYHSIVKGNTAKSREFPWHVGLYIIRATNRKTPTQQCGGTIISKSVVLTAAHCFYKSDGAQFDKKLFIVAADKLYREFIHPTDRSAQYRTIKQLIIPEVYQDISGNYADDIALLILRSPFTIQNYVRAVSIDWKHTGLEVIQPGLEGSVAGWGLTEEDGSPSDRLQYLTVPIVVRDECKRNSPADFIKYLTYDKFCAGYLNGSAVCKGDSGGGFITRTMENNRYQYFIRGIVSVGPNKGSSCDSHKFTGFTSILRHLEWLKTLIQYDSLLAPISEEPDIRFQN